MGKTLIIAEKPSVATDLSKVLGKKDVLGPFEKKGKDRNTYFENDTTVITSAVGHLVELKMPTATNGKSLPWKFDVLPAIPKKFELQPIESSESRLKLVLKLARRKDIDLIINACDAGREGELIFQYIIELGKITTEVKRLWMQSMTPNAIIQAWNDLREGADMKHLRDAAKCRSEADWLVGLNSTRALTCFRSRHGGFNITAAGRVQTPTLAILAKRENEILNFVSRDYSEVHGTFGVDAGEYLGKWVDTTFKKDPNDAHKKADRIWDKEQATSVVKRCQGQSATVTEDKKPSKQAAPLLYDLTSLQKEASSRFGFSAKQTLQIAQSLYERYKMLTYPRTDSKYLPEDYVGTVYSTMDEVANGSDTLGRFAKHVSSNKMVVKTKKVFDNKKISDHHAIIPTGRFVKLDEAAQKIFDLVTKRFIAIFYPPAEYEITKRLTIVDHGSVQDTFKTDGKVLTKAGWLEVYGRKVGDASSKDELVPVNAGESSLALEVARIDKETKPPAYYNESTLLSAMEGAGKLLEDDELKDAMAGRGLGTPATRASIIEGLLRQKYLARDARDIHVTPSGLNLIALIDEIGIESLASPSMTGDWEYKLHQIEDGELGRDTFMKEVLGFTEDIVMKAKGHAEMLQNKSYPDLDAPCPMCQSQPMRQSDSHYECREMDCKFRAKKFIAGRLLAPEEATELFTKKFLGPLEGFKSRFNKPFDAALEIDEKGKVNFVFDQDEPEDASELTEDQKVGEAKLPEGEVVKIYATEKAYFVPALADKDHKNGLRIAKVILQQMINTDQVIKLLEKGETGVLTGFISKRTKRPFSAQLTVDLKKHDIKFVFPERPAKKTAKKATKKVAKKAAKKS